MPVPDQYTDVFYGFQLSTDPGVMGTTLAWATGAEVPSITECEDHYTRFAQLWDGFITTLYSFGFAKFTTGTGAGDFTQEVAPSSPITGLNAGEAAANNTAILVAKITAAGGRRNRGRNYVPGVRASQVLSNGTLITAYRSSIQTAVDAWLLNEQTVGWGTPALLHQTGPVAPTTITNLLVRTQVATQRRRMRP